MRRLIVAAAVSIIALAGCSSGGKKPESGQPESNQEVAAQVAATQIKLQPGEYESTMKVLEFAMPGMPAGQTETMKAMMSGGAEKPYRYCFTAEQAAEGPKQLVSRMRQGDCKMSDFKTSANSVSGTMQCSFNGRGSSTTNFNGTYRSDGSSMTMESDQQMPGMAGKGMHMKMQVDTRRVGDCSA